MAIDLTSIRNQLLPGIRIITGKYKQIPEEWRGLFVTKNATLTQERALAVRYLGPAQQKSELGSIFFDNDAGDRWTYVMEPIEASIGYIISRIAIEDGQYRKDFNTSNLGLQHSMRAFWCAQAANVLNTATTYDSDVGGDGQALLSTAHPYDYGTWANTHSTPLALNEASVFANIKLMREGFVDEAGILQSVQPQELVIPPNLEEIAIRLLKTDKRPDTANNDVNAIPAMGLQSYRVLQYLTGRYRWFMKTDIPGLVHWQRRAFDSDIDTDFSTESLMVKATERAGFFCYDPRALTGENVTA